MVLRDMGYFDAYFQSVKGEGLDHQENLNVGLIRNRMRGTVSEETQESIKAGLVRAHMQGTVSDQMQESIKATLRHI